MREIIKIEHLTKSYEIGESQPYYTLRDFVVSSFKLPSQKSKTRPRKFKALENVSLSINEGDAVGLIGRNGAGKSTLLKILSRITYPDSGKITLRGRVASLLEVGTGFSPELTGRENIFLNGTILGMTRTEIKRKFDEIVDFSGIEKFIDTPVKKYSSGMYMRLAFAVAANLDSEILLVDEVLAVGDAEFQKKCLNKMDQITTKKNRTMIFVSHNLGAVELLCPQSVLLDQGKIVHKGTTQKVVNYYLDNPTYKGLVRYNRKNRKHQILEVSFTNDRNSNISSISSGTSFLIKIKYQIGERITKGLICLRFFKEGQMVFTSTQSDSSGNLNEFLPGTYFATAHIPAHLFNQGLYTLEVSVQNPGVEFFDKVEEIPFKISQEGDLRSSLFGGPISGFMCPILKYSIERI